MNKTVLIFVFLVIASCNKEKKQLRQNDEQNKVYSDVLPIFLAANLLNVFPPPQDDETYDRYFKGQINIVINDSTENISNEDKKEFLDSPEGPFRPSLSWFKNGKQIINFKLNSTKFLKKSESDLDRLSENEKFFCGKMDFSNVAFDINEQFAVFSISYRRCDSRKSGNGYRVYVKKEKSKWKIKKVISTWHS